MPSAPGPKARIGVPRDRYVIKSTTFRRVCIGGSGLVCCGKNWSDLSSKEGERKQETRAWCRSRECLGDECAMWVCQRVEWSECAG